MSSLHVRCVSGGELASHCEGDRCGWDCATWQAVGLPDYASHEDQADVMLRAIAALQDGAASTAVQCALRSMEQEWRNYRARTRKTRPSPIWLRSPEDRAYVKKLRTLHAQLKRIESAKARLEHYRVFLQIAPAARQASYAAREANRAEAVEAQESWLDENGRCPCLPHESCGLGCPNYLLGAQAAWYARSLHVGRRAPLVVIRRSTDHRGGRCRGGPRGG